jgi:hypothetical protein
MAFWSQNITGTGRLVRVLCGIIFLAAAVVLYLEGVQGWAWIVGGVGVFVIVEGLVGWCVLRACRFKTPS